MLASALFSKSDCVRLWPGVSGWPFPTRSLARLVQPGRRVAPVGGRPATRHRRSLPRVDPATPAELDNAVAAGNHAHTTGVISADVGIDILLRRGIEMPWGGASQTAMRADSVGGRI
jgi:hypothetical protein